MNIEGLIVQLKIEENNMKSDKKTGGQLSKAKVNVVKTNSKKQKKQGNNKKVRFKAATIVKKQDIVK